MFCLFCVVWGCLFVLRCLFRVVCLMGLLLLLFVLFGSLFFGCVTWVDLFCCDCVWLVCFVWFGLFVLVCDLFVLVCALR